MTVASERARTSDDARMPLRFFVEYNNAWWFEIITAVEVPIAAYDAGSDSGFIVLDISYGPDLLRAAQHVGLPASASSESGPMPPLLSS